MRHEAVYEALYWWRVWPALAGGPLPDEDFVGCEIALEILVTVLGNDAEHFLYAALLKQVSYVAFLLLNLADVDDLLDAENTPAGRSLPY